VRRRFPDDFLDTVSRTTTLVDSSPICLACSPPPVPPIRDLDKFHTTGRRRRYGTKILADLEVDEGALMMI
jgi:hypothetical protein